MELYILVRQDKVCVVAANAWRECHAVRWLGCLVVAKCKWGDIIARWKTRKNTGNGNDFVYGPAGISKATARETCLTSLTCADRMKVRQEDSPTLEQTPSRERRNVQRFVCLGWRWLGGRLRDGLGTFDKWVKDLLIVLDKLVWWPWWVLHHALTPDQYQRVIDIKEPLLIEGFYWSTLEIFAPTQLFASWAAQWGLPRAADSSRGWGHYFYPIILVNAPSSAITPERPLSI